MNISLTDVSIESSLEKLMRRKTPKKLVLTTWTLTFDVVGYLNKLHAKGISVTCVYAKLVDCNKIECKFNAVYNRSCHAKIWIIDDEVYVGSANLVSDTIINVTIQVTNDQIKQKVIDLADDLVKRKPIYVRNYVLRHA